MEFRKYHLFFSCGTMKFSLFLLFLLLLFDSPQGSIISHKRSIRALNTTLETNFNGTYERRNPCTNAEIETTSYVASHEFRHHTEENNWSDYTHKCSSIISSFLQALGNLVHFNHKQNGIFNFHINTSISQKQDGHCKHGKRTSCDTLPTITIEATDCELSPRLPCENLSGEQLSQDKNKERKDAICQDLLNEKIHRRNQIASEKALKTSNFSQNFALNTPQGYTENEMTPIPSLGATAAEGGAKWPETENVWSLGNIILPATEIVTSLEPEYSTAGSLIDSSESAQTNCQTEQYPDLFKPSVTLKSQRDPENYAPSQGTESSTLVDPKKLKIKASESFNEPSPSHRHYLSKTSHFNQETTPQPIDNEDPFYTNQFSNLPFREQRPTAYSEQLFDDNLDRQVPDNEFLPNEQVENSFIFPDQIPKTRYSPQEPISTKNHEPKNSAFEVNPFSLQQQFPVAIGQKQFLQSGKQLDNFEKIQKFPNSDISSETETTSFPFQTYLAKYEEAPLNKISKAEPPQIPNFTSLERQFVDYDDQTPALGLSENYPVPPAQAPSIKNTQDNTFAGQESNETPRERAQAMDYPDEFSKTQPAFENNLGFLTTEDTFSPNNDQGVSPSDDFSTFNIKKPLTDPPTWTSDERFPTEKPFYDGNENFSTLSPKRPQFYLANKSPFLTSETQKWVPNYSEENSDDSSTDKVYHAESLLFSDQYQSTARPESLVLPNYSDQYEDVEEAQSIPESNSFDPLIQPDSELTTDKPYLQSYSTTPENQANVFTPFGERPSPLQYPTDITSNQKLSSSYDSAADFESFSPSEGEMFSDEYLTTLPPEHDSFENSQEILTTFDPYQDQLRQTSFFPTLEEKFASTFPGQILNEDAMSPTPEASTLSSEQSSRDIYTSSTSASTFFDDYQNSLFSKPDIEPSFTTQPNPTFNEDTYDPTTEPYVTNDRKTYSEDSQPTNSTVFGIDELKQQPSSYSNQNSDLTLEQPLNYASKTPLPFQNYDPSQLQLPQFFEKSEDSRPDGEPFSDQQFSNFPTELPKAESFMNYDSEQQPDSFAPQMEQYADDNVLISGQSKQNSNTTPYFAEDIPQENQTIFSPQPFTPYENEELFPGRPPFENVENTSSPDFNTDDEYFQPIIANNYQKPHLPAKFFKDSDARSEKFSTESFTTPVPPFSFPFEGFSSPSNYKTTPKNQAQVEELLVSLDQSPDENLPSQFKEPAPSFLAPFRDENKFNSDFQSEKSLKQSFELATTGEKPTQSTIPVYESQSKPSFYSDAIEPFPPYAEKQYFSADQSKVQEVFIPEQKPFSKPPTSDLSEYDSSTSSEYQPTEDPAETEMNNYSISDSDNFESFPAVDQQTGEITNPDRFSDFYLKEPSTDFFPSADLPLAQNSPDSPNGQTIFYSDNRQPSSVVFEPQSLITATANDQSRSLELQSSSNPESVLSFSDDKPFATLPEKTQFDIPPRANSLALTKNQELQSNDFQTSDSFNPYNQPQKVTSYTNYPSEDFSKDSQTSSEDLDSVVLPESPITKPEIHRNVNPAPNRQTAAKFNAFQSSQRGPKNHKHFSSSAPLQLTKFKDKEVLPNNDYSPSLKSTSQIEPSVYNYNKQVFNPYSEPKPQPYRYQLEPSPQTLLEKYPDVTSTAEKEIPFDIDETTAPPVPEAHSSYVNEQSESQYVQENPKISDYSSSLALEQQLKPQPFYNYLPDILDENIAEETILSSPETSNFENIPLFEVQPDKSVVSSSYPVYNEAYERDTADTDYNQPESSESDLVDESPNTNFDVQTPYLNNPIQSSISFPPVPDVQSRSNDFMPFPQSPSSISYQLNNNSDEPTQQSGGIPRRYSSKTQSKEDISFVTDNVSPQFQPATAIYKDKEITEMSSISKPQPQTSLDFADQLSDLRDQQYQITPDAVLPSEFEPVPSMSFPSVSAQGNIPEFDSSDNDANNQPSTQELDAMTDTLDQTQNIFDSKPPSEVPNSSPLYTAITTQFQRQPSAINSERPYNNQEKFSPYNQYEPQPIVDSSNRPISAEYQQDPFFPPAVNDRFSSSVSPRGQRYFNEAFPFPKAQRLTTSKYGQDLDPREKFQAQPPYLPRYPNDVSFLNNEKNRFPSIISRHAATQRFESQPHPRNFPNRYPNYNARPRPNAPIRNVYNNEPERKTNSASPQYFTNDAVQAVNSFERPLPFNLDQYPNRPEIESSPDQTIKNANSPSYDDYDQALSSKLPNEKLLEYHEGITPELYSENPQTIQDRDMIEEEPREGSDDFPPETDSPLGFNRKADPYDFPDRSSPNNEPPFPSPPVEKEQHSNPLFQTLESHLVFPLHEHLRPSDSEKESLKDSLSFDPENQNEFRDASAVPPPYSVGRDSGLDFVSHQRSLQPLNGVNTVQDVTNTRQPDSRALVSDPNIPSNKPGENCVSCSGQNPTPVLCPFDPILKGNMTAPSYYILISKLPVGDDKEEQFKVEKVYLGDGMPLNCTLSAEETFPTSLYTLIPFSAAGTVKLRTKSDFA